MSQLPSVRSVQFIDNYFPVIDGVTETVHEYARHMDAVVVCPAMESHYLEKHSFSYPVLTSGTIRVPFPGMPAPFRNWIRSFRRRLPKRSRTFFIFTAPPCLGNTRSPWGGR